MTSLPSSRAFSASICAIRSGVSSPAFSSSIFASHSAPSAASPSSTSIVPRSSERSISANSASTSSAWGTFRSGLPSAKIRPSFLAPVIPKSACDASPIPFTAQPSTATSIGSVYASSRDSISATTESMSNCRRPQVGQAISTGPRSRICSALRISQATFTSSSAWKVERLIRIVSPTPSASSVPRPTADLSDPDHFVPASVIPRWIGYGIRSARRRLAAIVLGTLVDLIDTLKSSKRSDSIISTNSVAAVTRASTGLSRSSACRCLGSEPELTPIRIGTPACVARSATSATFSRPPMLPGLRRMQCAPASIALSASV